MKLTGQGSVNTQRHMQPRTSKVIAIALACLVVLLPIQTKSDDPPPPEDSWLALCVVGVAGVAIGAVYIIANSCKPKYYWLKDSEKPPNYWVGTATKKQCEVEGWKRIGGPYERLEDAPAQHPPDTNVVSLVNTPLLNIKVQSSTNGQSWQTVYEEVNTLEDFGYFPTNAVGGMFRLEVGEY